MPDRNRTHNTQRPKSQNTTIKPKNIQNGQSPRKQRGKKPK